MGHCARERFRKQNGGNIGKANAASFWLSDTRREKDAFLAHAIGKMDSPLFDR
jgi:hypothetical protein